MSAQQQAASGGFPIASVTALTFTVLKLCGVINWSWWWVLSPLWIALALIVACGLVVVLYAFIKNWCQ